MGLSKRFDHEEIQERLRQRWEDEGVYRFRRDAGREVFAIDTPPPTVSGKLHLGHIYSYSHADFIARYMRMSGREVFYPMGFDDNGLPTEHLVERTLGETAEEMGREAFVSACLEIGEKAAGEYRELWQRLGLSVDWGHTYHTIGTRARRIAQWSFLDLYEKGLVYRAEAPVIWCPRCETAIAQAELEDLERKSRFHELIFRMEGREEVRIATTRPELLPACVAIFVHPEDERYRAVIGERAEVPLTGCEVPIVADERADPEKGTGAAMCCTFGDAVDVEWWREHDLPLIELIGRDGRLGENAGEFAGLKIGEGRKQIVERLGEEAILTKTWEIEQSVRVHERCDAPVEYVVAPQWFVRVVDFKEEWLRAGEEIAWSPAHMKSRYLQWVESVGWDWCISRQRFFGVPFPLWRCGDCGEVRLAEVGQLPVDPRESVPDDACACGSDRWIGEEDVMDTWATSSLTPQIAGGWGEGDGLYEQIFPMGMRTQSHEIIRTWAFYTIVKAHHHWGKVPWRSVAISGWGLAPEGTGKISKSKGGGPIAPAEVFRRYPVDAVRYWAASTGPGKDALISEEKIQSGKKLLTKLWNVARFAERFLEGYRPPEEVPPLSPADAWILARLQRVIRSATAGFERFDYAAAKSDVEEFFWRDLADNYLEMAKKRLYAEEAEVRVGARFALWVCLRDMVSMLAPFLPYVTEEIYGELFGAGDGRTSIHRANWPQIDARLDDPEMEDVGRLLLAVATAVRRFKSEAGLSLGRELERLQIAGGNGMCGKLEAAAVDIASVTRARRVEFVGVVENGLERVETEEGIEVGIAV